MAKGNTGQGQYKPSARRSLTNAPSSEIRTPSTGNDFLSGDLSSYLNGTGLGGSYRNTGVGGQNQYGNLLMGANSWNQGMTGGNQFSQFNPWSMFGGNQTNFNARPPSHPPNYPQPGPTTPKSYNANEASLKLREGLNQNLSDDEIGQLLGVMGKKRTDTFTDEDIARGKTLVGQNKPGYIGPNPPANQIDPGGMGRPMPSPSANMGDMNTQLRSKLTRDLNQDEIGMLMGAMGGSPNVDTAVNLIRQHNPSLLRG